MEANQALLFESSVVALVGFILIYRVIGVGWALVIVAIKTLLPVAYFMGYLGEPWVLLDDLTYEAHAYRLLQSGMSPIDLLIDGDARDQLQMMAGGGHFLYLWWNLLAISIFGDHYFAPVLMNVGVSYLAARFFYRLIRYDLGDQTEHCKFLFALFLIHPEILTWTSFLNLKDTLVVTLILALMCSLLTILRGKRLKGALLSLALIYVFSAIRFYLPALLIAAFLALVMVRMSGWKRILILPPLLTLLYLLLPSDASLLELVKGDMFLQGVVRYLLTPRPWSLEDEYSFLLVSSLVHWIMLLPAVLMIPRLWRGGDAGKLSLLFLAVVSAFFAIVPELQGPRHRFQIYFVFIWLQGAALLFTRNALKQR